MSNQHDEKGQFDDADMHSLFASDHVRVPRELDLQILAAAREEASASGTKSDLDYTDTYRKGGLKEVFPQIISVAAAVVFAVTLVPLMMNSPDLGTEHANTPNSITYEKQVASTPADEPLEEAVRSEFRRDRANGTSATIELVDDISVGGADEGVQIQAGRSISHLDEDDVESPSVTVATAPEAAVQQELTAIVQPLPKIAAEQETLSVAEDRKTPAVAKERETPAVAEERKAPAVAERAPMASASSTLAMETKKAESIERLQRTDNESTVAQSKDSELTDMALADSLSNDLNEDADAFDPISKNRQQIVDARQYRVDEKSWREKILEQFKAEEIEFARTELRLFRIVYPNSDWLKKLPAGLDEKP